MNYDLSEEQNIIKTSANKFLSKECPSEFVREMAEDKKGFTSELWKGMAELGWMSLLIPEKYEGFGGSFLDLAVLLSEMGYFCLPGPFFSSTVLAGLTLLEAGSEARRAEILPHLAEGKRLLTLAWVEEDGTYAPEGIKLAAQSKEGHYVLSGTKLFVPYAQIADYLLVVARTEGEPGQVQGIAVFVVDAKAKGIRLTPIKTIAADKQFQVDFDNVSVSSDDVIGDPDEGISMARSVLEKSAAIQCAEAAGGAASGSPCSAPAPSIEKATFAAASDSSLRSNPAPLAMIAIASPSCMYSRSFAWNGPPPSCSM